jgi:hypothetical protein
MTDRGTRVRWTTAALVAPAAAALFTGTTVWASAHQPATASTTATAAKAPEKTVDPLVESLRVAVDANTEQVQKLRESVATLQKQAAAIAKGARVPVVKVASASRSTSTRKATTRSSSSTSRTSAPAKSAAKAPVATSGGS